MKRIGTNLIAASFGFVLVVGLVLLLAAAYAPASAASRAAQPAPAAGAIAASQAAVAAPVLESQSFMASAVVPVLVAAQGGLTSVLPAKPLAPSLTTWAVSPAAVDMIVSFEIVSPAYYSKRLQRPVWPGGASGVTWGIGYDGGHQTADRIDADWAAHADRQRLRRTAGVIGGAAKPLARQLHDVRTPLRLAEQVFAASTLPRYAGMTRSAFAKGWECVGADPQGSLVATVYNRGTSMRGKSRREMRQLRDECVPACDTGCMATAYRSMKRLWVGTPLETGLGRRYEATARLAEGART